MSITGGILAFAGVVVIGVLVPIALWACEDFIDERRARRQGRR